ncbi:hypothetical protein FEM33_17545 [Dyadobacter flavalbus]|uniref:Uncharacterized protein n=1 Tax=Dyadobacter flavalbus TaxID=2579942 RepID=A0A5M8QT93_9BACT|nr:hypothetical protein [Dyadobacter flavalbus]KAA6438491.1 hypothetical protein FEM33_17545 [Dyadobacter flavalbus]
MKKLYIFTYLISLFISGCKSDDKVPVIDQRDSSVGTYVCDVKVENYTTNTLLRSYVDTIMITKSGRKEVQLSSAKKIQLPVLKVLDRDSYYGLFTTLYFEKGELIMSSGPDSAFYEYRGYKIR